MVFWKKKIQAPFWYVIQRSKNGQFPFSVLPYSPASATARPAPLSRKPFPTSSPLVYHQAPITTDLSQPSSVDSSRIHGCSTSNLWFFAIDFSFQNIWVFFFYSNQITQNWSEVGNLNPKHNDYRIFVSLTLLLIWFFDLFQWTKGLSNAMCCLAGYDKCFSGSFPRGWLNRVRFLSIYLYVLYTCAIVLLPINPAYHGISLSVWTF